MGSFMKKSIFDEQTSKALKKWHMDAKKRRLGKGGKSPALTLGKESGSMGSSPSFTLSSASGPALHRFKTTGHSTRSNMYDDRSTSDNETDPLSPQTLLQDKSLIRVDPCDDHLVEVTEQHHPEEGGDDDDHNFSFVIPDQLKQT